MEIWQASLLTLGVAGLAALAAYLLYRSRSKRIELQRLYLNTITIIEQEQKRLDDWELAWPPPPIEVAEDRAKERLNHIKTFFSRREILFTEEISEKTRILMDEFLESHESIPDVPRKKFYDDPFGACGQMARLIWQAKRPETLLAERVVDAIVGIRRLQNDSNNHSNRHKPSYPTIRLEPLKSEKYSRKSFPWVVVIETNNSEWYRQRLTEISDYLGIAVAFGPPRKLRLYGACQVGFGAEGVAGGCIETDKGMYQITCSHVLSPNCKSLVVRSNVQNDGYEPDAALISHGNPCFKCPPYSTNCNCATELDIQSQIQNRSSVVKRHPDCNRREGIIRNRAHGFDIDGIFHRFPHLEILPKIEKLGPVILPIWDRAFSKPGDSGSWVMDSSSDIWFGMVVGGDEYFLSTFVAEAEPLSSYFKLLCINKGLGNDPTFKTL